MILDKKYFLFTFFPYKSSAKLLGNLCELHIRTTFTLKN